MGQTDSLRRNSSTTSSMARRKSVQERPPTPPGPDGVSGFHRRKLSQDVIAEQPMPSVARNVYEAPYSGLMPPSPSTNRRVSNAPSDYGASLYDMYIDRDDETRSADVHQRNSHFLHPSSSSPSARQSMVEGGGTRHIEVTERADGSVVWQVIAGLADRSSSYSNSMLGGGHSRATSDASQLSFSNQQRDSLTSPNSSKGLSSNLNEGFSNEDGRSLFARTKGKHRKSFSFDGNDAPPVPAFRSSGAAEVEEQMQQSKQQQPLKTNKSTSMANLEFDMATPPGAAATRIVYTSDAELANMLESMAGPDKASAKFEFQRVVNSANSNNGNGTRPSSTWTEGNRTSKGGSENMEERYKIEAEIYSLLQRDGLPSSLAATVAKQHANQVNDNLQTQSMNNSNINTNTAITRSSVSSS
jgi:hypothetical protein